VDPAKITFLFGEVPDGFDPDDPDDRLTLFTVEHGGEGDELSAREQVGFRAAIASQIASDDPPQVWRTAQRLLAEGRDRLPPPPSEPPPPLPRASPELQHALLSFRDEQEHRWCDENVPALGGITPREAAAEPTRRDELTRLIASFPEIDPSSGIVGLRPTRLRELPGLRNT
jgi:hypothetical protein